MCKALEELEARGREEGREEGRQQGIEKSIETLLKKFSAEETAEMLELPLEEVLFVQDKRLERERSIEKQGNERTPGRTGRQYPVFLCISAKLQILAIMVC